MRRALPAGMHDAGRQGSDAPPHGHVPAIDAAAPAGAPAAPQAAGAYPAPRPYAGDLRCNGVLTA